MRTSPFPRVAVTTACGRPASCSSPSGAIGNVWLITACDIDLVYQRYLADAECGAGPQCSATRADQRSAIRMLFGPSFTWKAASRKGGGPMFTGASLLKP